MIYITGAVLTNETAAVSIRTILAPDDGHIFGTCSVM
jgi:hypothetical protein